MTVSLRFHWCLISAGNQTIIADSKDKVEVIVPSRFTACDVSRCPPSRTFAALIRRRLDQTLLTQRMSPALNDGKENQR
jgi:hypothetical protein